MADKTVSDSDWMIVRLTGTWLIFFGVGQPWRTFEEKSTAATEVESCAVFPVKFIRIGLRFATN